MKEPYFPDAPRNGITDNWSKNWKTNNFKFIINNSKLIDNYWLKYNFLTTLNFRHFGVWNRQHWATTWSTSILAKVIHFGIQNFLLFCWILYRWYHGLTKSHCYFFFSRRLVTLARCYFGWATGGLLRLGEAFFGFSYPVISKGGYRQLVKQPRTRFMAVSWEKNTRARITYTHFAIRNISSCNCF